MDFIRAEGFIFGHVADEGWMDAQAGELLRYRKNIGAEQIKIFTDIKVSPYPYILSGIENLNKKTLGTRIRSIQVTPSTRAL